MENILIISSNSAAADSLTGFIRDSFNCNVSTADSAQQARGIISGNRSWELIVINTPLRDENGLGLAEYAAEVTAASCIMLVRAEAYEKLSPSADRSDVILVSKPFSKQLLYQVIKAVDTSMRRSYALYEETVRLERKIDEIKLVDKAKFKLMQYRGMTEEEAHSYVEQYAMKNRKKKTVAASEIIDKINEQYL